MAHIIDLLALKNLVREVLTFCTGPLQHTMCAWCSLSLASLSGCVSPRCRSQRARMRSHLFVEQLEDRLVPSTFVVDELLDTHAVNLLSGTDAAGHVSLRSAIEAADHLGGDQTIQFDPSVFAAQQTIKLIHGMLRLKDSGPGAITILGPAGGVSISGNHASRVFGVTTGTHANLTGLTITRGAITADGGGIYNAGTLTLSDSTVSGNTALIRSSAHGEGIYCYDGSGGGIFNTGSLTLNNSTISGNTAQWDGAGVYNAVGGTVKLNNCTVSGNSKAANPYVYLSYGGGIDNRGIATLINSTVSGNSATAYGGGLYNSGTATLLDSTISGNSAHWGGGGICGYGSATTILNSCTISGNSAGSGGGIACPDEYDSDPVTLINCTISGNTATERGGGIYNAWGNEVTLINSTISGNTADLGGGIYNHSYLKLNNTIIARNTSHLGDGDVVGYVSSPSANNLIGDGIGITGGISNHSNGNQIGTHAAPINPLLAPLGNYGGPTRTMPLLPGSPAIDAGSNAAVPAAVTSDQRGLPRIVNGKVDIGAFESKGFTLTLVSGDNQCTPLNTPLSCPLVVAITANNPAEPVAGGRLTFAIPGGRFKRIIDGNGQGSLPTLPSSSVAGLSSVIVSAAGVPASGSVSFHLTNDPVVTPATSAVPATASSAPLVIHGMGFDPNGTNNVILIDLTNPGSIVTVDSITVNSTTQLTLKVSGTFADGDVLSAVVTTDEASSAPTSVAVVAPVLTPATTAVPANASSSPLVINGFGFDPTGINTVTIIDLTHPASSVTVDDVVATSATALTMTLSGNFTAGDLLSAIVTTDGASSAATVVAVGTPVVTPATAFVPVKAASASLVINGFGFDPRGSNTVKLVDLTHPADKVAVGKIMALSATSLRVTVSGTFAAGDVLAAMVTTDKVSSGVVPVARAARPPAITSGGSATFTVGKASSFLIRTTGFPAAALIETGLLPAGMVWTDNGDGTATLSGTPLAGSARSTPYSITIRASNGIGIAATQTFKLTIHQATAITSAAPTSAPA